MRTPLMRDRVASGPWACTRPLPDRPSSSTCSPYFQMALWQTQRQRLRGWRRRWRVRGQRRRRPPNSWRERKRLRRGGTRSRSGGYWSCRGQLTRREPAPTFCASTFQVSTGGFKLFVRCRRARVAFVCVCVCCAWRRVGLCQLITLHWRFPIYVSVLESDIRSNRSDASLLRESVAALVAELAAIHDAGPADDDGQCRPAMCARAGSFYVFLVVFFGLFVEL